jgi:cytochrome c
MKGKQSGRNPIQERGGHMMRVAALAMCLGVGLWAAAGPAKEKAQGGDAVRGRVVFQQCSMCHNSESTEKKLGPGLKGLFHRSKLQNGKKVTERAIRAQIDMGGNGMPPYKDILSSQEKDDLIAYLKTL